MEHKKPFIDVKVNGVSTGLTNAARPESSGDDPDDRYGTSTGQQHIVKDINSPHSSQKKTFKSVVQRHFVKDKLFFLVHDLLKSIDDEKQAQEDLIASFRTAREVTEPIRRQSIASASHHIKRRKRRDDKPLLERIKQTRRESLQPLEDIEIYNKNAAAVGELKLKANELDNEGDNDRVKLDRIEEERVISPMKPPSASEKNNVKVDNEQVNGNEKFESCSSDTDSASSKSRQRPKSSPASETEKLSAIYQLNKDENTSEVDQLVLDSVLRESEKVDTEDTKHFEKKTTDKTEDDRTLEVEDSESADLTVEVESNADSDEDETNIRVIGSNDEIEDNDLDDDAYDGGNEDEFKKLNDPNFCISVMEYNRAPASLHPTLDPIAEASSESFQSMPSSSRDSTSIIEIQAKQSSLPWRDTNNVTNTFSENGRIKARDNRVDTLKMQGLNDIDDHQYDKKDGHTNYVQEIDGKENNHDKVHSKTRSQRQKSDKPRITYAEYKNTTFEENYKEKFDSSCASAKHRSGKTSNENTKSNTYRKTEHHREYSHRKSNDSKDVNDDSEKKNKSKSKEAAKKLISIDLLGVYEDNTDLQRVSRSEINTPKQTSRPEKERSKCSPKRSRSASPKKKRGHERRKYDLKPLPPKLISSSNSRSKSAVNSHRVKAEVSSHSSSTSSFEDMKDSYKTLQNLKDERRYRRPDTVLWERLDISEGDTKNKLERVRWADKCDNTHRYSGLTEGDANDNSDLNGRRVTWNIPINEQIKNITGSKNVPDITRLSKTVPREERVGRLYIDLKQERRASGFAEYRRLCAPEQKEDIDEFTHL
ncbi:hybrid signal transduction histidine kinase M-like [Mercenaria mercenaria]|uniref:hybrid signal transduction histidine kinase M-like n=1 Tax=Mercenaria mercenaria TaxID=6596 RepID=UPI00234F0B30|nr:hybrid signal transduction histidine kinase M-like [Mercenaria mercenaria]